MDIELGRRGPERGRGELEGPRRGVQDQGNGGGVGW